jgi:3-phenylpropionate/trans-cinnamate dioxygenase ferredoxin subunit
MRPARSRLVCPHAFALLSQGFVEGDKVECSLHEAVFHIPTGKCLKAPADRDLTTYRVRVEGSDLLIELPA